MVYDRYPNKDKRDALGGVIITRREVIRVTRREQIFIFTKHKDFRDHELQCVYRWVRVIREVIETHVFEDSEEKEEEGGGVTDESDAHETPINATNREDTNYPLADGYKVDYDRLPDLKKKTSATGKYDRPVYKEEWKWNGIDHRRAEGCRQDAEKLDGTNKEFISVLTYFTDFVLFLTIFLLMKSFWWRPTEQLKALILTLVISSSSLGSGC